MPDNPPSLPFYARPPGSGPSPKGIFNDPATSVKLAKTLSKAIQPHRGKRKVYKIVHRAMKEPKK